MIFRNCVILFSIILLPFTVVADTASQANWVGGSGVLGPVTEFGDVFYNCSNIHFFSSLTLKDYKNLVNCDFWHAWSVYAEDMDGDGDMDALGGASLSGGSIIWWENDDGSGTSWTEHLVVSDFDEPRSVYAEDMDGDGDMDILGAAMGDHEIAWWENDNGSGTSWTKHLVDDNFNVPRSVHAEDVDGDGDIDVLGASWADDEITWWENDNGSGTSWTEHLVVCDFDKPKSVYAEDMDGDGDIDVLGAAGDGDEIAWWENDNGSGTSWTKHLVDGAYMDPTSVYAEDMDGDGDIDVLGSSWYFKEITWWENEDGLGTNWTKNVVGSGFTEPRSVYAEDMDGDGDIDVLAASTSPAVYSDISWWANEDGLGKNWVEHIVDNCFSEVQSVYAEDMDGDGDMDVLGASWAFNEITWWDLSSLSNEGVLISSILYIGGDADWESIDWVSVEPAGTSVSFQVRASDDYNSMGSWSDTLSAPCSLDGILEDYDSFVQYRAILSTTDSTITPSLDDVTFTWDPLSIEGSEEPDQFELLPICPNPANSTSMLQFTLPEPMSVSLSVFDLSGRLVFEKMGENYTTGYHSITLNDLASGIFFCRMTSGDYTATQRFVVIE